MGLGLLGALGGLGKAGSDIADQTMRERANDDHLRKMEAMRIAAEERAVSRADDRDTRKLALEDARITQRRGLLGQVLGQMPEGASDFDRSRALLDAGLIDEAKAYGELGKAGDTSEWRQKNLELQHERRLAAIENARLKLEATINKQDSGATSLQKDARWLVDNGMAKDLSEAFSMLKTDQSESTVRALTQQILADHRNYNMSPQEARSRAIQILAAESGEVSSNAQRPDAQGAPSAPAGKDYSHMWK